MYSDVTGIILSGGKSTRMGENKSFLRVKNKFIIERVTDLMTSIFSSNIIITNNPEEYEFLGLPVYTDIYRLKGPLAGIHSGLINSGSEKNFIISCDMPLMTSDLIQYISDFRTDKKVTVCKADGFIQQLAGIYHKSVSNIAEEMLQSEETETRDNIQPKRKCKVLSLLDEVNAEIIDANTIDFYDGSQFYNMNRPDDYKFILSKLES